ncbi:MAG: hypothetical protein WBM96_14160 [Polyangiales bacterium]|jgi:hypothetical protein
MGEDTGKQTRSEYLVRPVFEPKQEASATRRRTFRSELVALPLPLIKPRLDRVDHHRGERDFLIEGVLANALVKIDREVNRCLASADPTV